MTAPEEIPEAARFINWIRNSRGAMFRGKLLWTLVGTLRQTAAVELPLDDCLKILRAQFSAPIFLPEKGEWVCRLFQTARAHHIERQSQNPWVRGMRP